MNRTMQRAGLAGALIVASLAGCDNVNWGGVDVAIVPPPPKAAGPQETGIEVGVENVPDGPILYYVVRSARVGVMVPVGEIEGDSLRPLRAAADPQQYANRFIAEQMRQGSEFVLFHHGVRAGTLIVQSAEAPPGDACTALPRATGTMELGPEAANVNEFVALSKLNAPQVPRRLDRPLEVSRTMQVLAPILAEQMMRARHAGLPGNWQRSMAQLQPFPVPSSPDPGFATTFLVGDTLGPGLDDQGHSTFYVGIPNQLSYDTVYVDFHAYEQTGKFAPRVIDFLDWDRDDWGELLLQVYGVSDSWFEAVGRAADGTWRRIFTDRCAPVAPSAGDTLGPPPPRTRIPAPNPSPPDTASH